MNGGCVIRLNGLFNLYFFVVCIGFRLITNSPLSTVGQVAGVTMDRTRPSYNNVYQVQTSHRPMEKDISSKPLPLLLSFWTVKVIITSPSTITRIIKIMFMAIALGM